MRGPLIERRGQQDGRRERKRRSREGRLRRCGGIGGKKCVSCDFRGRNQKVVRGHVMLPH